MPIRQTSPPSSIIDVEGVQIDLSSLSIRAAIASALAFVPGVGPILSAIAAVIPIRGKTQHLGVAEGYRYAREFADDFHAQLREALADEKLRTAFTRYAARVLHARYASRWPDGSARSELDRMLRIGQSAMKDESYTVYYLASYYFFRNADAEHLREEFERDFAAHIVEDVEAFVEKLKAQEEEEQTTSKVGLAIAAIPVFALLGLFAKRKFL